MDYNLQSQYKRVVSHPPSNYSKEPGSTVQGKKRQTSSRNMNRTARKDQVEKTKAHKGKGTEQSRATEQREGTEQRKEQSREKEQIFSLSLSLQVWYNHICTFTILEHTNQPNVGKSINLPAESL